jgi:hypothetical protein
MSNATELLRRALVYIDDYDSQGLELYGEIESFLAAEEQYDALRERYVEGLGNSMKDCKESFEREAERVKELLAAEPEAEPESERQDIDWQSNEGAVYLFAGWLTTRDAVISCGITENAAPMAKAIKEYEAEWPERFTKPAASEADEPTDIPTIAYQLGYQEGKKTRPSPATRKPMTEEEIDEEIATNEHYCERSFAEGVRWAEKHHGIGGNDE